MTQEETESSLCGNQHKRSSFFFLLHCPTQTRVSRYLLFFIVIIAQKKLHLCFGASRSFTHVPPHSSPTQFAHRYKCVVSGQKHPKHPHKDKKTSRLFYGRTQNCQMAQAQRFKRIIDVPQFSLTCKINSRPISPQHDEFLRFYYGGFI